MQNLSYMDRIKAFYAWLKLVTSSDTILFKRDMDSIKCRKNT